ncbi:MAG: carboxymuconolactone decarboxylase family protein [Sphingomonadaceae bacterium]
MTDEREKGLALFREIYGDAMADGLMANVAKGTPFSAKQSEWTIDWAFGSVWTREAMERKMRSAAVLGMLVAQGASDEIRYHTKMGVANGLTRAEIEEIFYTAIPYCGFPKANTAKQAMLAGFADLDTAGGDGAG